MIKLEDIQLVVDKAIEGTDMFLVELKISLDNRIEVALDSMQGVDIDGCVAVSRFIEQFFDREEEDFELTVASAGLTEPFKVFRQYQKNLEKEVEVLLKNGQKLKGMLIAATEEAISLQYEAKELVEGKKRKQTVVKVDILPLENIKSTKLVINVR